MICPNCNNNTKSLAYHVCSFMDFHIIADSAWIGDAILRLDAIDLILASGFHNSHSSVLLTEIISAPRQVDFLYNTYFANIHFRKHSKHKLSTYFEHLYRLDYRFRMTYMFYSYHFVIRPYLENKTFLPLIGDRLDEIMYNTLD